MDIAGFLLLMVLLAAQTIGMIFAARWLRWMMDRDYERDCEKTRQKALKDLVG